MKTYGNTDASGTRKNVKDVKFWGNGDTWKLLSKAWSEEEGWMKSTKVLPIFPIGCLVQVTTQQGDNIAESIAFVPGAALREFTDDEGQVVRRKLVVPNQGAI